MKGLFSNHVLLTGKVLDLQLMRQNVVMSNLANIDTPKYKRKALLFEDDLQAALNLNMKGKMARTAPGHIPHVFSIDDFGPDMRSNLKHRVVAGQDNVDLDKEMALMAKNQLKYNALTTVLKSNFSGLQTIISEGSK